MSNSSNALKRLRELTRRIFLRNVSDNIQRFEYPPGLHQVAGLALVEQLEPRLMLSAVSFLDAVDVDVGGAPYAIVTGDFNGDTRQDFAVTNFDDDTVTVLYGLAGGGFGNALTVTVGDGPRGIVAGDFNGDTRLDLAVVNSLDNDVSIHYGLVAGGFVDRADVAVGANPQDIVSDDFNDDTRLDLVVSNKDDNDVSVLYGLLAGGFGDRADVAVGGAPMGLAVGDFNNDNRPDVAVANSGDNDVSVLRGLVAGGLGNRSDTGVGTNPTDVVSTDFDNDGYFDFVVSNTGDDQISVLYGVWTGGFGNRQDLTVGDAPTGLVLTDLDGDGRTDIGVSNSGDGDVSVLYQAANGVFDDRQDLAVGAGPMGLASADLNGNGQNDLAVVNETDDDVSLLYTDDLSTPELAYDFGTLVHNTPVAKTNAIGGDDGTVDFFKFTMNKAGKFIGTLDGLTANVDMELQTDDGTVLETSASAGTADESIVRFLAAGTYYVRVFSSSGTSTPHTVTVKATFDRDLQSRARAKNLGTLGSGWVIQNGRIGGHDRNDYYKIQVKGIKRVRAVLSGLSANADLALQNASGAVLATSSNAGTANDVINYVVTTGTYYLRVYTTSMASTAYTLKARATGDRDRQTRQRAQDVGYIGAPRTFAGTVGAEDRNDYFKFSTRSFRRRVNIQLTGLTADVSLALYDSAGRLLRTSAQAGTSNELITRVLRPGTYYVRVFVPGLTLLNTTTPYNLRLAAPRA